MTRKKSQVMFWIVEQKDEDADTPKKPSPAARPKKRSTTSYANTAYQPSSKARTNASSVPSSRARAKANPVPRRSPRDSTKAAIHTRTLPQSGSPKKSARRNPRGAAVVQPRSGNVPKPPAVQTRSSDPKRPITVSFDETAYQGRQELTNFLIRYSGQAANRILSVKRIKPSAITNPFLSEIAKLKDYPHGVRCQGYDWARAKQKIEERNWRVDDDEAAAAIREKSRESILVGLGGDLPVDKGKATVKVESEAETEPEIPESDIEDAVEHLEMAAEPRRAESICTTRHRKAATKLFKTELDMDVNRMPPTKKVEPPLQGKLKLPTKRQRDDSEMDADFNFDAEPDIDSKEEQPEDITEPPRKKMILKKAKEGSGDDADFAPNDKSDINGDDEPLSIAVWSRKGKDAAMKAAEGRWGDSGLQSDSEQPKKKIAKRGKESVDADYESNAETKTVSDDESPQNIVNAPRKAMPKKAAKRARDEAESDPDSVYVRTKAPRRDSGLAK